MLDTITILNRLNYVKDFYISFGNFNASTDAVLENINIKVSKYDKVTLNRINSKIRELN